MGRSSGQLRRALDALGRRARAHEIFRLDALQSRYDVFRLPYTLRILLENVLRREDGATVTAADVEAVAAWDAKAEPSREISFTPGPRAPAGLHRRAGGRRPRRDARRDARPRRRPAEDQPAPPRRARHRPLRAGRRLREPAARSSATPSSSSSATGSATRSCAGARRRSTNFKVVPPNTGIVHQVNLEFLARVVEERDGQAFPDTLVGTDSHTTMINGLGVLGWGVGGIEAEAAMLGEAISMLVPQVVGFKLTRRAARGRDRDRPRAHGDADPARDRRRREVRRVLRRGPRAPAARRPRHDREHVARVRRHLRVLPRRRRDAALSPADRPRRATGSRSSRRTARRTASGTTPASTRRTRRWSSSTSRSVEPSLAGPRRPQDRIALRDAKRAFVEELPSFGVDYGNGHDEGVAESFPASDPPAEMSPGHDAAPRTRSWQVERDVAVAEHQRRARARSTARRSCSTTAPS